MNKERIDILDNIIDCLDEIDIRYLMNFAIPCRGMAIKRTKEKENTIEKLRKASEILFNPKSSELHRIVAFNDISENHNKVSIDEVFNKQRGKK